MSDTEHAKAFFEALKKLNEIIAAANNAGLEVKVETIDHRSMLDLSRTTLTGLIVRPYRS